MAHDGDPVDVTAADLSACPERWHLRRVRATGIWCRYHEHSSFAGVWLGTPPGSPDHGTFRVRVVGTWVYTGAEAGRGFGHMGQWPGVLRVERFESLDLHDRGPGTPRDGLMGLFNRRALLERFAEQRERGPLAVALMDVDQLHALNEGHGHDVGDTVLQRLAGAVAAAVRPVDILGRWAGDELVALLPATPIEVARGVAEAAAAAARGVEVRAGAQVVRVTISAGVVLVRAGEELPAAVARAAGAVDAARRGGRDRVVAHDDDGAGASPSGAQRVARPAER